MNQRRVFLQVLGASALTGACGAEPDRDLGGDAVGAGSGSSVGAGGGSGGGLPENYKVLGNVADLPTGLFLPVTSASVLLARDAGGVYAVTSICPHASCDMCTKGSFSANGVVCNCHGSGFDLNGGVTQGPALKPLVHFDCTVAADGSIGVDKAKLVDPAFRAPVG